MTKQNINMILQPPLTWTKLSTEHQVLRALVQKELCSKDYKEVSGETKATSLWKCKHHSNWILTPCQPHKVSSRWGNISQEYHIQLLTKRIIENRHELVRDRMLLRGWAVSWRSTTFWHRLDAGKAEVGEDPPREPPLQVQTDVCHSLQTTHHWDLSHDTEHTVWIYHIKHSTVIISYTAHTFESVVLNTAHTHTKHLDLL